MKIFEQYNLTVIKSSLSKYTNSGSDFLNLYMKAYQERNPCFVVNSIEKFLKEGRIKVNSPVDGAISIGVASFCGYGRHYILMKAKTDHYWLIVQEQGFIDVIVTSTSIQYFSFKPVALRVLKNLPSIIKYFESLDDFSERLQGLYMFNGRPFHFFYDQLKSALYFQQNIDQKLLANYPFYIKDSYIENEKFLKNSLSVDNPNEIGLLIKSTIFPQGDIGAMKSSWAKDAMEAMESKLNRMAPNNFNRDKYDFVLWVGVTGQKRSWLNQLSGYENIIKNISKHFDEVLVIVDGWTSRHHEQINIKEDEEVFLKIKEACSSYADVVSIIGKNYSTKISIGNTIDFFISNAGTGSVVPLRFCKKNGVLHSNGKVFAFHDKYKERGQIVNVVKSDFVQLDSDNSKKFDLINYTISWKVIYNLLIDVVNESWELDIKKTTLCTQDFQYLDNSPENIADEIYQQFMNDFISNRELSINTLRDLSIQYANQGRYDIAYKLMAKAHELRPDGKFIEREMKHYEKQLKLVK
ncbi:hypothetical protein [Psychrobacter celer]|uniref:hypothetical protein n=1 Tax=Psychrobacter celer TaxID=306572 RepID=UPI0018DF993E|nr:hypothetical protein [Psychrobacter celer]